MPSNVYSFTALPRDFNWQTVLSARSVFQHILLKSLNSDEDNDYGNVWWCCWFNISH